MHNFLSAVGFKCIKNHKQLNSLFEKIMEEPDYFQCISMYDDTDFAVMSREFAPGMGVSLYGILDESNEFKPQFYVPYVKSTTPSTDVECLFHEHADKESYAGSCDDYRINITMIFSVANFMELRGMILRTGDMPKSRSIAFSGMSVDGKILLPIQKTEKEKEEAKMLAKKRVEMMQSIKHMDAGMVEQMGRQEIEMIHEVGMQLRTNDLYSVIDTYFMPYGVECDQYALMGTIENVTLVKNTLTGEEIYRLLIDCNDMPFEIAIQKDDLWGIPEVGRRFKGSIWLTANIEFE